MRKDYKKGATVAEKIANAKAHKQEIEAIQQSIAKWEAIAGTQQRRAQAKEQQRREEQLAEQERLRQEAEAVETQSEEVGRTFSSDEATIIIANMERKAEVALDIELTPENWYSQFGEEGIVESPIGKVKMGEHQYIKLADNKRQGYFGMVKPTLENPDIILEEYDPEEGAERDTKLLFVKTFVKANGGRVVHFENVTVQKGSMEVSISSHEVKASSLAKKMQNDKVLHLNERLLNSEERLIEPQSEGSDLVPTPSRVSSGNKDNVSLAENKVNEGKVAEQKKNTQRGRKQIEKAKKELQEALSEGDVRNIAKAISKFHTNVYRGAEATAEEISLFENAVKWLAEKGYEYVDILGQRYEPGMKYIAEFSTDETLPPGVKIIDGVKRPLLLKDGKLMQAAEIHVRQSPFESEEEKKEWEEHQRQQAQLEGEQALQGAPDVVDDTPVDARLRGYRRVSGERVDRQSPVAGVVGNDVDIRFSDKEVAKGKIAVIEADELQASHIQGVRNPKHFIDEAQPKERNDEASILSAQRIAKNIRPQEITSSVTAYTGAPSVNSRGEVIQGNNRSDALKLMWSSYPAQSAEYKQYLIDHAAELGLDAEAIRQMTNPVLVNMLDVSDEKAIELGQYVASDTESGGTERIKPKNLIKRMGDKMRSFANILLRSTDEDASLNALIDINGVDALKWLHERKFISDTQYRSAFNARGELSAEAKNDLKGILYQSIFEGANAQLEVMFNALPAKAQKAILATAHRDFDSPSSESMLKELQASIKLYYYLSNFANFQNAKNYKEIQAAVEDWSRQYQFDDVTGESFLPSNNFSNFAMHLAVMYKGDTQKHIQGVFNNIYDLIQGAKEDNLFEVADKTPRTLAEAIKETLNIDYNGRNGSNVLGGSVQTSQQSRGGSNRENPSGKRTESREEPAKPARGTASNSKQDEVGVFGKIYRQFKGKAKEAIDFLLKTKSGEAVGALHHPEVGDISLVWGDNKSGLAKIAKKHPEVLDNLQEIIGDMHIVSSSDNRIKLESNTHFAVVSREFLGQPREQWLLTAYEKKNSASDNTMDTDETSNGSKRNDTATSQNTVSTNKGSEKSRNNNELEEENKEREFAIRLGEPIDELEEQIDNGIKHETRQVYHIDGNPDKAIVWVSRWEDNDPGNKKSEQFFEYKGRNIGDDVEAVLKAVDLATNVADAESEVNTNPTEAQNKAPNKAEGGEEYLSDEWLQNQLPARRVEKLPKGHKWSDGVKITRKGKVNNYNDSETLTGLFVGDDLYLKHGKRVYVIGNARNHPATVVRLRAEYLGGSMSNAILDDVINELYVKEGLPINGNKRITRPLFQQTAEELSNNSDAKQLATEAVMTALEGAGIEVEVVTDEQAQEMIEVLGETAESYKKSAPETASVQDEHQPTVVSSADGAKVLKEIDTAIDEYEEKSSQSKTFIGDIAKILGAKKHGSNSQYATFEAKNGRVFTIRLANHNAKVSNFDNHNESEGISIVVTSTPNQGINNDGEAHVVEFFYDAIKLRKADGKPLVEILKSIKQSLYSGEYKDNTGLAEVQEVNVPEFFRTASGTVYGWTDGKKIYLTKAGMNPNTPIHEYTHLWAKAMMQKNAKGWESIKGLLRGTPMWEAVMNDKNYSNIHSNEDAVASEVLSRISGKENAKRMTEEAQKMLEEAGNDVFARANAVSLLDRMKRALEKFWNWVGVNLFGIEKFESVEQVTDRVLWDMVNGTELDTHKIVAEAKKNGTYMKAPNGKPSNLDERQWAHVRTQAFKDWFGDWENNPEEASKVVDENGEPRVVYHSGASGITTFSRDFDKKGIGRQFWGGGFYFGTNKSKGEWSRRYQGKTGTEASEYAVFLNIRNPKYGAIKGDIKDSEYDGAILPSQKTTDGQTEPIYVASTPNQIKSATDNVGTYSRENDDIRYQIIGEQGAQNLDRAEEAKRENEADSQEEVLFRVDDEAELIAVHNISADNLAKVFELGAFVMPSIAVTNVDLGFTEFGEISLLFNKDSINPSDRRNKVYGGDAWTPTMPSIDIKVDSSKLSDIKERIMELLGKEMSGMFNVSTYLHPENVTYKVENHGLDAFKREDYMKLAYLRDKGVDMEVPRKGADYGNIPNEIIDVLKANGADIKEVYENTSQFYDEHKDVVDAIRDIRNRKEAQKYEDWKSPSRDRIIENTLAKPYSFGEFSRDIDAAYRMARDLENGGLRTVVDMSKLYGLLGEAVPTEDADYGKWVDDLLESIVEKRGIRNDRDLFTASGNRRSWEALHDDVTAENLLKSMLAENSQGGSGFFNSSVFGASAKRYETIEEVREQGKKRLQRIDKEDYDVWRDDVQSRLWTIAEGFVPKSSGLGMIDAMIELAEVIGKHKDSKGIYRALKQEYTSVTKEHAEAIAEIVKEIQDYATDYFEAKPERVVGLNEVRLAVVPDNVDKATMKMLKSNGIPIVKYKNGDSQDRKEVVAKSVRKLNKKEDGILFRKDEVSEVNERFNEALEKQINGTLPKGYIYELGMPSEILLSAGIPNLPIELNSTRLEDKSKKFGHDYDLSEVKDLVNRD